MFKRVKLFALLSAGLFFVKNNMFKKITTIFALGALLCSVTSSCVTRYGLSHGKAVEHIAFSPDGALLFSVSLGFAKIWDVGTGKLLYTLKRI